MAITILKQPIGIYPAYNDAYIKFQSDQLNPDFAEVSISGGSETPQKVFSIDNTFIFNLKDLVQQEFNILEFTDPLSFLESEWVKLWGQGNKSISFSISVTTGETSENRSLTLDFYAGLLQQEVTTEEVPSIIEFSYWEGFPFDFGIRSVVSGSDVVIKNTVTGIKTEGITTLASGSQRVKIDDGRNNNWTTNNVLPLKNGRNELELSYNNNFKSNLIVNKKSDVSGVYLKWFDAETGFYNYHLFDIERTLTKSSSSGGRISTNKFLNINEVGNSTKELKKESSENIRVTSSVTANEYERLSSLLDSPSVEMYTVNRPNELGIFIDVDVTGSISSSTKRVNNSISLTISLPNRQTIGV